MKHYATVVYQSDEDSVWIAEASDVAPCSAHDDTREVTVAELGVAMQAWHDVARDKGLQIPEPRFRPASVAAE